MKKNPQFEVVKSAIATGVAVFTLGLTWGVYVYTQPSELEQFTKVGQAFFADFQSHTQIAKMELAALDRDAKPLTFNLAKRDDIWTIPSHYDYPAEAGERLSRTATDLIGLVRHRMVSSEKGAQKRFGTLDPTSEEGKNDPENAGKLLRFVDRGGEVVFELIIGRELESKEKTGDMFLGFEQETERLYYTRVPSEKETYLAKLDLDISTRFSDWINPDLLELNSREMRQLRVDNSRLETREVATPLGIVLDKEPVEGEELILVKSDDFEPWKLPDLNEAEEQINAKLVDELVATIDNIELVGVRPRFKYQGQSVLGPDLSFRFPENVANNVQAQQAIVDDLQRELMSRGFALTRDGNSGDIKVVSEHGEFSALTKDGLVYTLYFGARISGSEEAIEIGNAEPVVDAGEPEDGEKNVDEDGGAGEKDSEKVDDADQSEGRFLLVRVTFDESAMEGRPVPPVAPEPLVLPPGVGEEKSTEAEQGAADETGAGEKIDESTEQSAPPKEQDVQKETEEQTGQTEGERRIDSAQQGEVPGEQGSPDEGRGPFAQDEQQEQSQEQAQEQEVEKEQQGEQQDANSEAAKVLEQEQEGVSEAKQDLEKAEGGKQEAVEQEAVEQEGAEQEAVEQEGAAVQDTEQTPPPTMTREDMQKALDAEFAKQQAAFEEQQRQYALDVKSFEDRVAKAREKAERLSERFANWYYVVPAGKLDRLRMTRAEVVQPKVADGEDNDLPINNPLNLPPGFQLPEGFELPPSRLPNQ